MQVTPKDQTTMVELYNPAKTDRAAAGPPAEEAAGRPAVSRDRDTVELNDAAARFQEARETIRTLPDIREEKVAALKAQIEAGTYAIQPERVAAKLIRDALLDDPLD